MRARVTITGAIASGPGRRWRARFAAACLRRPPGSRWLAISLRSVPGLRRHAQSPQLLCHPFPVTACANTRLSGHVRAVLFHNGTWGDWRENLRHMLRQHRPAGLLSDTRIAASIVDLCGTAVLDRLPGRWVFFDRDFTELYGDWREWQGMRASNLYFLPLRDDSPSSSSQRILKLSATCGNPDTRKRRK